MTAARDRPVCLLREGARVPHHPRRRPPHGQRDTGARRDIPTQEDDKTWLLKLKPGIPFHDGSVLKASDVKYTVESINSKELNSLYNNVYNFIDSMDVVDDNTIRFHLKSPFGAFLERLASLAPVPQAVAEAKGLDEFGLVSSRDWPVRVRIVPTGR